MPFALSQGTPPKARPGALGKYPQHYPALPLSSVTHFPPWAPPHLHRSTYQPQSAPPGHSGRRSLACALEKETQSFLPPSGMTASPSRLGPSEDHPVTEAGVGGSRMHRGHGP